MGTFSVKNGANKRVRSWALGGASPLKSLLSTPVAIKELYPLVCVCARACVCVCVWEVLYTFV